MRRKTATDVERIEPAQTPPLELALHVSRYRFASRFVAGRSVLDAGCGLGYGSNEFTDGVPSSYFGVDRSLEAIRHARRRYGAPGRVFLAADIASLPFATGQLDVVLSFEVLEHIRDVDRYLAELRRVLRSGGTCILSTPNKRWSVVEKTWLHNPYHLREYEAHEFAKLLGTHFPDVVVMGQQEGSRAGVVRSVERAYGRFLDRTGLRRLGDLVPRGLRAWAHALVVEVASRRRGVRPDTIAASDYEFTADNVEDARILLGVCRVI